MSDNNHASHLSVSENGAGRYQQNVLSGRHVLIADEPVHAGGDDAGLAPYDFLLAALGACTSMTLRMYAERKDWPLESVEVGLRLENKDGLQIERVLTIAGLDDEQMARLADISERTPVTLTLKGGVPIHTRLA